MSAPRWAYNAYGVGRQLPDVSGMQRPCRCTWCSRVYDLGTVTVVQRYLDCSVWKCPGCGVLVDDRGETGWKSRADYVRLDADGREMKR